MHVALIIGTRPEAIKGAPVAAELMRRPDVATTVVHTGQHDVLMPTLLTRFGIHVDYQLTVMRPGQSLSALAARLLSELDPLLNRLSPDVVVVVGDTVTAQMGALAAFFAEIPVAHVEAGLRTYRPEAPFPEETARRNIATFAHWHFAPSQRAADHLLAERVPGFVAVTGNPVVDALLRLRSFWQKPTRWHGKRLVLATLHRRENHRHLEHMFRALGHLADDPALTVIVPVHPNPAVQRAAQVLERSRVRRIPPMDYIPWLRLLSRADLVITDSGGVQEEAPVLGVPLLVAREETERTEIVDGQFGYLVGHDPERILAMANKALTGELPFRRGSPYGDGYAALRICDHLLGATPARLGDDPGAVTLRGPRDGPVPPPKPGGSFS